MGLQNVQDWPRTNSGDEGVEAEVALLRQGQSGDTAALERLLAPYERGLYTLCYGVLGHADDARDAVQETFLCALRGLNDFRGAAGFRTWLFRIAINVCLQWKRARRPVQGWNDLEADLVSPALSPETVVQQRLQVCKALDALPPRHRALILLKEREGWSAVEIAAAMQWNEKKVHNELFKARRTLADWVRREETAE